MACSSGPTGTSSSGTLGMVASASSSALSSSRLLASASPRKVFSSATSAISFAAVASSFCALALPISFDAALRRACASSSPTICARRASSLAITSSTVARASADETPRFVSASARTSGLSRIHLISSMGSSPVGGYLPRLLVIPAGGNKHLAVQPRCGPARHGRVRPGHPRLSLGVCCFAWITGTSPVMTAGVGPYAALPAAASRAASSRARRRSTIFTDTMDPS